MSYSTYNKVYNPQFQTSVVNAYQFTPRQNKVIFIRPVSQPPVVESDKDKQITPEGLKTSDPRVWGPHLWKYMHCAAANYPDNPSDKQIDDMKTWLKTLTVTIPCQACRHHYGNYIQKYGPNLDEICSSKDNLFKFIVDIHNKVNERNNKPIVSLEEAKEMYCK